MLARLNNKPSRKTTAENSCGRRSSVSFSEYDDFVVGFMTEDLPLISTDGGTGKINGCWDGDEVIGGSTGTDQHQSSFLTLRQVLRSSVGVIGESNMGLTEKVVLLNGKICALKRFRNVSLRRREFGRRIVRLAMVTKQCKYLVPINAYFYAKRIKFVVCEYYPMGSLSDLLTSARKLGRTPLNWNQRLKIIVSVARAIEFIHTRCFSSTSEEKQFSKLLNVHGNIKSSNVMINMDFTARLSDYGFTTLAERVLSVSDTGQQKCPATNNSSSPSLLQVVGRNLEYSQTRSQKSDIYNFGIIILDILRVQGGADEEGSHERIVKVNEEEDDDMFEFCVEGNERIQALKVLEIGRACLYRLPGARPTIEMILHRLAELF